MTTRVSSRGAAAPTARGGLLRRLFEQRELSIFLVVLVVAIILKFASPNFLNQANLTALVLGLVGSVTGLMTGLLGVGGGFLIVPLMRRFTDLSMQGIVATSLFVITLVSGGGVVNAYLSGAHFPALETSCFVAAMITGMFFSSGAPRKCWSMA